MDKLCALDVREHSLRAVEALSKAVDVALDRCTPEEHAAVEQGATVVMGKIDRGLFDLIYSSFPGLDHRNHEVTLIEVGEVIAQGAYFLLDADGVRHEVEVVMGKPRLRGDGATYACPYRISGFGVDWRFYANGVDAVQALQNAMESIKSALGSRNPWQGRLRWEAGQGEELWLPHWEEHDG